jgi:hypothetical protein
VGRQARQKAEQREQRRREKADPEAAELAAAADAAFNQALPRKWKVDWAGFERLRTEAKAKLDIDWPDWCYLPWMAVAWQLAGDLGVAEAFKRGDSGFVEYGMDYFGQVMASLIPWRLGRVVVRFDPDLESVLASTPLEREIPGAVLQGLPMWSMYLSTPQFDDVRGVFVSLDAACTGPRIDALQGPPQQDEVFLLFDTPEGAIASTVWFGAGSLVDSLAAQELDLVEVGKGDQLAANRSTLARLCGRPYAEVVANVLAHVLYLCSDEPDLMRGPLREVGGARRGRAGGAIPEGVQVWSAGYRLGAALRRARQEAAAEPGPPTGRVVAPHMRSSHWHLYWTGPRTQAQTPVLKLLAPIAVNFRLQDGEGSPVTVVRPAGVREDTSEV